MRRRDLLALMSALVVAGCGREAKAPPSVDLSIASDGDFLAYKPDTLTVPAGAKVTLTFHHAGTIISQQHDWVLAKPGTMDALVAEIDEAARGAGGEDGNFLKPDDPRVIAATKPIGKGETTTITFTAPAPGDYPFFCSTPGHAETMRGVLHVTAD